MRWLRPLRHSPRLSLRRWLRPLRHSPRLSLRRWPRLLHRNSQLSLSLRLRLRRGLTLGPCQITLLRRKST